LKYLALISIFCFGVLFGTASAGQRSNLEHQLLIGTKSLSAEDAAYASRGLGKLISKDKLSGMFRLQLREGLAPNKATAILKQRKGVKFVFPGSVTNVNSASLVSVQEHLEYIDAIKELQAGKTKQVEEEGDFYEALAYYLKSRVDSSGNVDAAAIQKAAQQRDLMAPARLSGVRPNVPGTGWSFIGPNNMDIPYNEYYGTPPLAGRITAIAYDPANNNNIWLGSGGGGLWKSTNGGTTWTVLSDKWKYTTVSSIAIDPTNSNKIYVGTGDYDGFYRGYNLGMMVTTNGGTTWSNTGVANFGQLAVSHVVVDPITPTIVTVTAGHGAGSDFFNGGVWRSTDSGQTWTKASPANSGYSALVITKPDGSNNVVYWAAGGVGESGGVLYKSTDHGVTWTSVPAPSNVSVTAYAMAASRVTPNKVYLMDTAGDAVYESTDGGATWPVISNSASFPSGYNWSQSNYDYFLGTVQTSASTEALFCGLITVAYTLDDGQTWVDYGKTYDASGSALAHNDQHVFVASTDGSQAMLGNDGGIFKLTFTNLTAGNIGFTPLNANLGITQFYAMAADPTNANVVLGGAQDNASPASRGDLNNWKNLYGGDGGWCAIDPNKQYEYTTSNGTVVQYAYEGAAIQEIHDVFDNPTGFITPIITSNDGAKVFACNSFLNIFTVATNSWSVSSQRLASGSQDYIQCLSAQPNNNGRVFTGSTDGKIWMTPDQGATWKELDNGLPLAVVGRVTPLIGVNSNQLLAGFQNTGLRHLYLCQDVTAATPQWTDVSGTGGSSPLPDVPVNAIVIDPFQFNSVWYVGTDVGVFMTKDAGATWQNLSNAFGLPNVMVDDLEKGAGYLYAATFGRGMWRIPLVAPTTLTNLTLSKATIVGGQPVTGTVSFSNAPGASGVAFHLDNSNGAVAPTPATGGIILGPTSSTSTLNITTNTVTSNQTVTFTATFNGVSKAATLTVTPQSVAPSSITVPPTFYGGNSATGTVKIAATSASNVLINLASSNTNAATVPANVMITAGTTSANFTVISKAVSANATSTITAATAAGSVHTAITVVPAPLYSVTTSPTTVTGPLNTYGIVTIAGTAPTGGDVITLTSSNASVVKVAATATIVAGRYNADFAITAFAVTAPASATITAKLGTVTKTVTMTVNPQPITLTVPTTFLAGNAGTATVRLGVAAPAGGMTVTLTSNNAAATVPGSILIPAGSTSGTYSIVSHATSTSNVTVTFTAHATPGTATATAVVQPAPLFSVTSSASTVHASGSLTGTATLSGVAPPGGAVVHLSSTNTHLIVPATTTIAANGYHVAFPITTTAGGTGTVTITATYAGVTKTVTVTFN
jgi:hypothetical protein